MKKQFLSICLFSSFILLYSCKKDQNESRNFNAEAISNSNLDVQLNDLSSMATEMEDDLGKSLSSMIRNNPSLKLMIEANCLKQDRGDYEIRVDEMLTSAKNEKSVNQVKWQKVDSVAKKMKTLKSGRHPVIFIPSVETFDPEKIQRVNKTKSMGLFKGVKAKDTEQIIFVFKDSKSEDNKLFPGYTYDELGNKKFYGMISEEFAWNNNVWVVGYEEIRTSGNLKRYVPPVQEESTNSKLSTLTGSRDPSRYEFGGRINIANVGQLEAWIAGKLEMKYFVSNSTGMTIKERAFGQIERGLADNRWHDFQDLIGNWNSAIWGPYTYERWIEEDGGSPITVSTPVTPIPGGPTYNISTTMTSDDMDCGLAGVHYDDSFYGNFPYPSSSWRVYTISYMSFQRTSTGQIGGPL